MPTGDQNPTEPNPKQQQPDNEQQQQPEEQQEEEDEEEEEEDIPAPKMSLFEEIKQALADSPSDSEPDSDEEKDSDKDSDDEAPLVYVRPGDDPGAGDENTEENNLRTFGKILKPKKLRKEWEEEEEEVEDLEDLYNFPEDPENWQEEDLMELWADAPLEFNKPGWDPDWADEEDWEVMRKEVEEGRDPPIQPFYVPFRQPYPVIPDNHADIATPKDVIHELDRIEEFLKWVSYIFPDESSYEGTVFDDMAHGRGVFVAEMGLVRYEGEWFQNDMSGHGVVEVDIPGDVPIPGSKHEEEMRAEGHIIDMDFMTPEDRKWLEMDIEDSLRLTEGEYEIPWYEREEWVTYYGKKPEKGRYRYAGQWKHGRMHGCGQYDINERTVFGRFYFGKLLEQPYGCEDGIAAMHAGIAEVAAAKARMFINKPDGMVREMRGPFNDPQHPYFYEEEDVWMAPGFINQFYDVPDFWKTYVSEVDKERQMWLNSFYRSPLRLPMPAELEYWWQHDDTPEFEVLNMEPEPDPNDPSKKMISPVILHNPTGRIINYTMDEEHGVRLYWEPEDGVVDPDKVEYLPLGMDEFYGKDTDPPKENFLQRIFSSVEKKSKPFFEKMEKWVEEQIEHSEQRLELLEKELDLEEAEKTLEEAMAEVEKDLKEREKEEQRKAEMGLDEKDGREETPQDSAKKDEKVVEDEGDENEEGDEEEEEEEEEDGDDAPASFGSANADQKPNKNNPNGGKPGRSPFSASSLSFTTSALASGIPSMLQRSFFSWKKTESMAKQTNLISRHKLPRDSLPIVCSVSFPSLLHGTERISNSMSQSLEIRAKNQRSIGKVCRISSLASLKKGNGKRKNPRNCGWLNAMPESILDNILSLHTPVDFLKKSEETNCDEPLYSSV